MISTTAHWSRPLGFNDRMKKFGMGSNNSRVESSDLLGPWTCF